MGKGGKTMRKRRVLAILLALSLVVSGNGMTVLAAETGVEQSVVTTQEETTGTSEESEVTETSDTAEEPEESETPEVTQEPEEGETPETTENPDEQEDPDAPKEDEAEEQPMEDADADSEDEQPAEEDAEDPAEEQEEPEETEAVLQNYVSRMVTFTDDTGMKVTYDANASTQYEYVVENGVLTEVKDKTTGEKISFTGNVVLEQPEEEEKHYTSIAASVFKGNSNITYVKLPMGVETITAEAFKGCTALKGVYLPASVNKIENSAFEGCTAMTQISVPKAVTSIGNSVFKGDAKLYLVSIKDADYSELKSIGNEAFSGCTVLSHLCSHSDFIFPIKLVTIGTAAFQDCKAITKVDFSANKMLESIGTNAFNGCTALTELSPGETLSEIPEGAFAGCKALININFVNGKSMTIGRYAFQNCLNLKQLVLPQTVTKICTDAFQGCTKLKLVEIKSYIIDIAPKAFPADAPDLVIVAEEGSDGYKYALENNFRIPGENAFYKYTVEDVNCVTMPLDEDSKGTKIEGKYIFPGGTIWVGTGDRSSETANANTENQNQGVKRGTTCKIYYNQTESQKKNYTFITDSLRCNGKTMQKKDGTYYFEMPAGGAVITAEFRAKTPDNIKGRKVTVEFSDGTPLRNGETDEYGYRGVELKVGQTSRMFLLDEEGNPIPAQKLSDVKSKNESVAKIDKNGVITAVGTGGKAMASTSVQVKVKGEDGQPITINRTVDVKATVAKSIILKASDYDGTFVEIKGETDGIQTASIKKNVVSDKEMKFKLKANVYDGEEGIGKELTWTTSNAKVATLKSSKTTAADPVNEISVVAGCEGEATITVTAKNPADSEIEKITQKFVVRVYEPGFKLTGSTVTVNPRMSEGSTIALISAYGMGLEDAKISLYEADSMGSTDFTATYEPQASSAVCKIFRIKPVSAAIENGTYKVRVGVNDEKSEKSLLPLTITVKEAVPKPTVKFNTNKAKFNLFYTDGGTTAEGEQMSLLTEITKLDGVKVREVTLEPLTQKADDRLFTENFVIDEEASKLAEGKVYIKRSGKAMQYTTQKKAAVTGNLVIYFEGYDDSAAKTMKVTMPTCTTAPSWALRTTKGTYRTDVTSAQDVSLVLYDKKSKTKEDVVLDKTCSVTAEATGDVALLKTEIEDKAIAVRFWPDKGSIKLVLHNPAWDRDQNGKERVLSYTYSVSVSNAKPTVKTNPNSVSLNLNYPEKAAQFTLVSNLGGVEIEKSQTFTPVVTKSNAAEIVKLQVAYENGEGIVSIKSGQTVKKGTYKFECNPEADVQGLKKVTLTVKVVDAKPSVKFGKGSLQLNTVVYENNSLSNNSLDKEGQQTIRYQETSERTFKVNGQPVGYTLAPVGDADDSAKTMIVCTTKNKAGAESHFDFSVEEDPAGEKDDVLKVSLKDRTLTAGTYSFRMTPRFLKEGMITVSAQPVTFQVKVINKSDIYLATSAKGKINLVNREGEASDKNGIVYTPSLKNIVGEIEAVKIYDDATLKEESKYFDIRMIEEGKDAGKLFVTPKKIAKTPQNEGDPIEYTYAELDNNKTYPVFIWAQVKGYAGDAKAKGGVRSNKINIKTAQVLPKVTLNKTSMDVYLSTKNYDADFVVKPKEGSVGTVEEIYFDEKDEMANDSFTLIQTPQADGSMKVTVHLKEAVSFANGTNSNIKFYVKYKGQGTNTSKTATGFTMKIKVN